MQRLILTIFSLMFLSTATAQVQIVTSIKPLQLIAQAIQGDHGQVHNLLPPGSSPHSFSLRPSDRRLLVQADLFYWIGPDMENFLINIAADNSASRAVQNISGLHLLYYGDEQHDHHNHDHEHAADSLDSHLWLAPENALVIARHITADLIALESSNADSYHDNLISFEQSLQAADQQIRDLLKPLRQRQFFVFHESLNYFEHSYQLQHADVFAINPEIQPGARHLQQMHQQLQQAGASCILTEPPAPPRIVTSLSKDLPVTVQQVDVLGHQAANYPQLLLEIAQNMAKCWQDR